MNGYLNISVRGTIWDKNIWKFDSSMLFQYKSLMALTFSAANDCRQGVKERVTLPEEACLLGEVQQQSVSAEMVMKVHFQRQSVSPVGSRAATKMWDHWYQANPGGFLAS